VLTAAGSRLDAGNLDDQTRRPHADGILGWPRRLAARLLGRARRQPHDAHHLAAPRDAPQAVEDAATTRQERGAVTAARLEGIQLAGRTVAHLINNDLTVTVGALDLLRAQDDVPPHVLALLDEAIGGIYAATRHVEQVRRITRVVTTHSPAGPSLDLDRCRDQE
jgi:hypothetical protein